MCVQVVDDIKTEYRVIITDQYTYLGKVICGTTKAHGIGSITFASGNQYYGEWHYDMIQGTGTFTWANGDEYNGDFKRNCRHGQGVLIWASGDKYEGEWYNSNRHGRGVYTYANGRIEEKTYIHGRLQE
jgi:hypothetical protein